MIEYVFPFLPITMNEAIKLIHGDMGGYFKIKRQFQDACVLEIAKSYRKTSSIVKIDIEFGFRSDFRDLDNCLIAVKCILDALVETKVIQGDSCKTVKELKLTYARCQNEYVHVMIIPIKTSR